MSKAALSATVQAHILKRVRQEADKLFKDTPLIINKGGKEEFNPKSPISLEQIRKETNPSQEASISRGGLQTLANNFLKLQDNNSLANSAFKLLSREDLFDGFSQFVLDKVNKPGESKTMRASTAYTYLGVKTQEDQTTAKLAKSKTDSLKDVVIVNNISHGKFNDYFTEYLNTVSTDKELVTFIRENIDTGHLTGVFNIKLQRIFGLNITQRNRADYRTLSVKFSDANEELNNLFQKIMLTVSDADYLSSNIVHNLELFSNTTKVTYDKNGPKVSVELQLSLLNQEIGRKLAASSGYLNKLLAAAKTTAIKADTITSGKMMQKFIESLKPLADEVGKVARIYKEKLDLPPEVRATVEKILNDNDTMQQLVSSEGSDPVLTSILKTVGLTLSGKRLPPKNVSGTKDKVTYGLKPKKVSPKVSVNIKRPKTYKTGSVIRPVSMITTDQSIISLQSLLNSSLYEQIRKNMGTGNRRDVLNFRTGRFANSVKVERISESRQGMITAFYSYMKNPYATFSQGGRQQYPRSRDPKLLISKSIREIAAPLVSNRLRAVNV